MGTPKKPVQLKVFVDKRKKKVMFAEAEEDFVEILCSFLTLPWFLSLLQWSLLTNNPLTNLVLGGGKPCSSSTTNTTLSNLALISSNSGQTQTLKLLVQKSNKKLLCAQVDNLFVELLFSFLTIPLGSSIRLTNDGSSSSGIRNLYNSISCLGDGNYLKSKEVKTMLLSPKAAVNIRATDFLPIYEVNARSDHFLKEHATFVVSNDLEVTACPSIATISNCNTLGVPVGDMEVLEVSIGEHEVS
ncbi:hypothetical protein L2E82_21747 [Cichorium intybus]|uniref:Uncharacterized protein n=1 Tax=Cichorium intybus TaxID=13427 RepID=A0ACB9DWD6_CICIN|nr:hypothetical protein L2E82_21747 [Cichorium intybus]